jgi:hypothetical protein
LAWRRDGEAWFSASALNALLGLAILRRQPGGLEPVLDRREGLPQQRLGHQAPGFGAAPGVLGERHCPPPA